jgi:hypothetical protein
MLKRKAKPSATNMYIDDIINKLVIDAITSSILHFFLTNSEFSLRNTFRHRGLFYAPRVI